MSVRWARAIHDQAHWLVIPVALLLLFPSAWMSVGFAACLALYGCRWIATGSPVPVSQANPAILTLLGMTAIGFVHSTAPDLAIVTAGQVVASVTVFFVVLERIQTREDLWRLAAVVVVIGLLIALATPFTVRWPSDKLFALPALLFQEWPKFDKVSNSNILGGALALSVPLAVSLVMQDRRALRILGAISLFPLLMVLVLLQSRGAWFGLALGLCAWAALYRRWLLPLIPLGLIAAFGINSWMGGPPPAQFVYGPVANPRIGTFIERQDMWVQSLYLIRANPVWGIGLGAYPRVAPYAWPYSPANPSQVQNHTHNLFLQVALDTGVLGSAAFIVLVVLAAAQAWKAYRGGLERSLAIGILASLVVLVVHGFGDVVVWGTSKPSVIWWMLLALALGLNRVGALAIEREDERLCPTAPTPSTLRSTWN